MVAFQGTIQGLLWQIGTVNRALVQAAKLLEDIRTGWGARPFRGRGLRISEYSQDGLNPSRTVAVARHFGLVHAKRLDHHVTRI